MIRRLPARPMQREGRWERRSCRKLGFPSAVVVSAKLVRAVLAVPAAPGVLAVLAVLARASIADVVLGLQPDPQEEGGSDH